jgi:hypothetical protein
VDEKRLTAPIGEKRGDGDSSENRE